ncbi:MAG: hypothetical protein EXR51_10285 [Dehalococcoidia bacterium]|nr:hypothetical protein [Dehalococcoidia bacterium]
MGVFQHRIAIAAAPDGPFIELDAMVATGPLYSLVPRRVLQELGVTPSRTRRFMLADGSLIERDVAEVVARVNGETAHTLCVFSDDGSLALLGACTLEGFALAVDPVNRRLVPMAEIPALLITVQDRQSDGDRSRRAEGSSPLPGALGVPLKNKILI